MATTRLQRKSKRNRIKATQRRARLQQLLGKPVIKKVSADLDKGNI
jgi:hypothetical protein